MNVLLISESFHQYESGGRVVRYIAKFLKEKGHNINIIITNPKRDDFEKDSLYREYNIIFLPFRRRFYNRLNRLFFNTKEIKVFRELLNDIHPEVVHFASFEVNKPARLIGEVKKKHIPVVLQPWTMDFFCFQRFGYRENENCTKCAKGNFLDAFRNGCTDQKGIVIQLERFFLKKAALKADVFLSSNEDLDRILLDYGVSREKIVRYPVPFDYTFLTPECKDTDGKFVFYGQANTHKGINVLVDVFKQMPDKNLTLYPLSNFIFSKKDNPNIEVVNNTSWENGLITAVASSKAVLIPSLWSSSTEYSLCEALLFKKPVILFNVGVHKLLFTHKQNAMVINPGDIEGFKRAVMELDEDETLRKKIGNNGYDTLLKVNDPNLLHSVLIDAYKKEEHRY